MIKRKIGKGKIVLRIYGCIILCIFSFFTIYAFRGEVLHFMSEKNLYKVEVTKSQEDKVKNNLIKYEATYDNMHKINKAIADVFPDYTFTVNSSAIMLPDLTVDENGEGVYYYFSTLEIAPNKQFLNYMSIIEVPVQNSNLTIALYPRFKAFLNVFIIIDFIISLSLSILVTFLILRFKKSAWCKKRMQKIMQYRAFRTLSITLILVNVLTGILAFGSFYIMYVNRYAFFEFYKENIYQKENYDTEIKKLEKQTKSYVLNKENKKDISQILYDMSSDYYEFILYERSGLYYLSNSNRIGSNFYFNTISDVGVVRNPDVYNSKIDFADQTGTVMVYSYPLLPLVIPYMTVIIFIALSLWIIPFLLFIRRKAEEIKKMQEDVVVLSTGAWQHEVSVMGYDEVAELGNHLNQMRISFLKNMESEKEARNANRDLITSLSHDLRTPLTALMGYLDIIKYDKCSIEQKEQYLIKSIQKVAQIRSLSDKMFEYFLIYGEEEKVELIPQSIEEWMDYVNECTLLLKQQGYQFEMALCENELFININMSMMKRVMDNLYSNIQKYADKEVATVIMSEVKENRFRFMMINKKCVGSDDVESNHIGLKSVEKIVEMHQGEIFIQDEKDNFMIILSFPLRNPMKH